MRALACIAALTCCPLASGCGGEAGDLMAIEVAGGVAEKRGPLEIVLASDGRGTCNDGSPETVPSELVIDARELERDLAELAEEGATFAGGGDGASYVVRIKAGTVRWSEGAAGLPAALPRTQLLALRLDRLLCRT